LNKLLDENYPKITLKNLQKDDLKDSLYFKLMLKIQASLEISQCIPSLIRMLEA